MVHSWRLEYLLFVHIGEAARITALKLELARLKAQIAQYALAQMNEETAPAPTALSASSAPAPPPPPPPPLPPQTQVSNKIVFKSFHLISQFQASDNLQNFCNGGNMPHHRDYVNSQLGGLFISMATTTFLQDCLVIVCVQLLLSSPPV